MPWAATMFGSSTKSFGVCAYYLDNNKFECKPDKEFPTLSIHEGIAIQQRENPTNETKMV